MTACWLSPIFQSPQVDFGYDVSDFYVINREYGNMDDFDNLIEKSNELGIKIMLDFVPNHTSDLHQWFIESEKGNPEYSDYYVWDDGFLNPSKFYYFYHDFYLIYFKFTIEKHLEEKICPQIIGNQCLVVLHGHGVMLENNFICINSQNNSQI